MEEVKGGGPRSSYRSNAPWLIACSLRFFRQNNNKMSFAITSPGQYSTLSQGSKKEIVIFFLLLLGLVVLSRFLLHSQRSYFRS